MTLSLYLCSSEGTETCGLHNDLLRCSPDDWYLYKQCYETRLQQNLTLNMEVASCYGRADDRAVVHRHSKTSRISVPRTKATQSLALSFFIFHTQTHTNTTHTHTHTPQALTLVFTTIIPPLISLLKNAAN